MKVTIEIDNYVCSISDASAVTLDDALELLESAIRGAGFVFDGNLTIEEAADTFLDSLDLDKRV